MQIKSPIDLFSPEKLRILEEADLKTLQELLRKRDKQKIRLNAFIYEIRKQIYNKQRKESNYQADYIYKLGRNLFYEKVGKKDNNEK